MGRLPLCGACLGKDLCAAYKGPRNIKRKILTVVITKTTYSVQKVR